MFAIVKVIISAIIIGVITEISRRYPQQGHCCFTNRQPFKYYMAIYTGGTDGQIK